MSCFDQTEAASEDVSMSSILRGASGRRDEREASDFVGLVVRESASAFGEAWARQLFGARAENALISGRMVSVCADGKSLMAEWEFKNNTERWAVDLDRVRFLSRLERVAMWAAQNPEEQVGRAVARVFDFGLQSGKVYTGTVCSYLGKDAAGMQPLWRVRHADGDEEDLDEHELARAYHKLEEHKKSALRDRKRRRDDKTQDGEDFASRRRRQQLKRNGGGGGGGAGDDEDVGLALSSGPVTYSQVLSALSEIDFPAQPSRTNVMRDGDAPPKGLVLGAVNIRAHGGIQIAQATRDRPNLARLLAKFFLYQCGDPEFTYTTIQINANYETALHVDKFNLGPSFIVGVGDWGPPSSSSLQRASSFDSSEEAAAEEVRDEEVAGQLWVQGRGVLDCRQTWVAFDGNTPHCTMPFSGTRFTLIYFTHCSQSILHERDRTFLSDLGFVMPHCDLIKAPHMRTAEERLDAGRVALKAFFNNKEAPDEDDNDDDRDSNDQIFVVDGAGNRPSSRVALLSACGTATTQESAPKVRRHVALQRASSSSLLPSSQQAADTREGTVEQVTPTTSEGAADDVGAEKFADDDNLDEKEHIYMSNEELTSNALVDRPKFKAFVEPWETTAAHKKDERGGARLLAKYAGLHIIDDDPYELAKDLPRKGKLSDGVVEGEREKARQANARGQVLKEHRFVQGVEWCRFARRWTAVTQLVDGRDDAVVEKYPLDEGLIRMIVAASDYNDRFEFFDAEECRWDYLEQHGEQSAIQSRGPHVPKKKRKTAHSSLGGDNHTLPRSSVGAMIKDDLAIVVSSVNPKKGLSAERYERYKRARTTQEFLELGGLRGDLQFDMIRGYVSLTNGADWQDLACVVERRTIREVQRAAASCPERREAKRVK